MQHFPLKTVRADGWFEKIGEQIGSFEPLCEIVGRRFVAFSLITGIRITELAVDRRSPENTLVVFAAADAEGLDSDGEPQRTTLGDFRRRLVASLLSPDEIAPPPSPHASSDTLQLFLGVKYLLLAPLFGYSLRTLILAEEHPPHLEIEIDDEVVQLELEDFRARVRNHVRDELERLAPSQQRGVIDLARVPEAQAALDRGEYATVRQLLGAWPAPLSMFLRTPDGQALSGEARSLITRALGMLAVALSRLGENDSSEEVFRLAIQYGQDGDVAAEVFEMLGSTWLDTHRAGEAIAALRRAINLGAPEKRVWPKLVQAFLERHRYVAALACLELAMKAGAEEAVLTPLRARVDEAMKQAATLRSAAASSVETARSP